MIFVTHDQAEALTLSDRVAVMDSGRVEQVGPPEEVYRRPATPFVARFLGRSNFLAGTVARSDAAGVTVALGEGLAVAAGPRPGLHAGQAVQLAIRQESIRLLPAGQDTGLANRFPATVVFHAFAGHAHHYVAQLADGRELEVATSGGAPPLARGTAAVAAWGPEDVVVLPGAGAER
jgi:ABC-type Fe3+/spermidine/putrescine transport system ATPase subunit